MVINSFKTGLFKVMVLVKWLQGCSNGLESTGAADDGWEEPEGGAVALHRQQVNNLCDIAL